MQAMRIKHTIEKNGELHLTNLSVEKGQQVELFLVFPPKIKEKGKKRLTAKQLLASVSSVCGKIEPILPIALIMHGNSGNKPKGGNVDNY